MAYPRYLLLVLLLAATVGITESQTRSEAIDLPQPPAQHMQAQPMAFVSTPLAFEQNLGQSQSPVEFLSRGNGYTLFLTPQSAVLRMTRETANPTGRVEQSNEPPLNHSQINDLQMNDSQMKHPEFQHQTGVVLRKTLVGAAPGVHAQGEQPLAARSNYFIGNDPKSWHTNVPRYAEVRYRGVYPGVDLLYYGNPGNLEYDFIVAPGSSLEQVRMRIEGAQGITIAPSGDLVLELGEGEVREHAAFYQTVNGARRKVEGRYELKAANEIGFVAMNYDHTRELVVDPVLLFSTYVSGSINSTAGNSGFGVAIQGNSLAVDSARNIYITGQTDSIDFPTSAGAFDRTRKGHSNAFVTKLNSTGTQLLYSTYLGGSVSETAVGIRVDGAGNAFVAGTTASTDFPTTAGAFQTRGSHVPFVTKLNSTGSKLLYSTYLGGSSGRDTATGIDIDDSDDAFITGETRSPDFPLTPGSFQPVFQFSANCPSTPAGSCFHTFVSKLNPGGTALVFSTLLAKTGRDTGRAIYIDRSNSANVSGNVVQTSDSDFPKTLAVGTLGAQPAFVTRLNLNGTGIVYSTWIGGTNTVPALGALTTDAQFNAYLAGSAAQGLPTTTGVVKPTIGNANAPSGFVVKLNSTGHFIYATYLGGSTSDQAEGIEKDGSGNAYVTGRTSSSDFPITANAFQKKLNQGAPCASTPCQSDAFVSVLNSTGTKFIYSSFLGGSNADEGKAIVSDSSHNAYVLGQTSSSNFTTTPGVFQRGFRGVKDAFVAKVVIAADLAIGSPTAPATIHHGQILTYNLLINNLGPDTSSNLVITDTLASGTSFVSAKLTGGTSPSSCKTPATTQNAGVITCNWTGLAAHATITVTIQVKVNAAVGSTLVNTFKVRAQTQDLHLNNNGVTFSTKVN